MAGYLYSLIAIALWALNFVIAVRLNHQISPVELSFYRWLAACVVISPLLPRLWHKRSHWQAQWRQLLWPAFLGISLFNTLVYLAAHHTSSINLSLIAITAPLFVILLKRFYYQHLYPPIIWLGVLLASVGIVLLISRGNWHTIASLQFSSGDLLMLLASMAFALYTVYLERHSIHALSQMEQLGLLIVLGWLLLVPVFIWQTSQTGFGSLNLETIGWVIYLGLFASVVSFYSWNRSIEQVGAAQTGASYYFIPVFVVLFSSVFLQETLHWIAIASFAFIFSGLWLVHFSARQVRA